MQNVFKKDSTSIKFKKLIIPTYVGNSGITVMALVYSLLLIRKKNDTVTSLHISFCTEKYL